MSCGGGARRNGATTFGDRIDRVNGALGLPGCEAVLQHLKPIGHAGHDIVQSLDNLQDTGLRCGDRTGDGRLDGFLERRGVGAG